MKTRNIFTCLLVMTLIGSGLLFPMTVQAAGDSTANVGCAFGYTLQSGLNFATQWKELYMNGGATQINFSAQPDDGIMQVSDFGFNFPFFENTYHGLYISTNGFVTFVPGTDAFRKNYAIPMETTPNNLIAGFWDDLTVGGTFNSGAAYYQTLGSAPNRMAVFEWYRVTRLGSSDPVTFEIVLHENGEIDLNYGAMLGILNQATVGIEDPDGVDGYQLIYDAPFLATNQSYRLVYPGSGARVKAKPDYQGGFLVNGRLDLPLTIVNTGTAQDSFTLQTTISGSPDGDVSMVDNMGVTLTTTPAIDPGQSYIAWIRVTSPDTTPAGTKWSGTVKAISVANTDRSFQVDFDAAIPVPFATFYLDSTTAMTKYISRDAQISAAAFPKFKGSSYAIARLPGFSYLLTWEEGGIGAAGPYKNIMKAVTAPLSGLLTPTANLTDNSGQSQMIFDVTPQAAVAPNGMVGVVFVRWTLNGSGQVNSNIYLARLDAMGTLLPPIKNLTQNNTYYTDQIYSHPVISATPNGQFVITFERLTPVSGGDSAKDIEVLAVDASGTTVLNQRLLTNGQVSGYDYSAPAITAMQSGSVFITFLSYLPGQTNKVNTLVYNPDDNSAGPIQSINNASGEGPRLVTLPSGSILVAWIESDMLGAGYAIFNSQGVKTGSSPLTLNSLNGWNIDQISLASTADGNVLITWQDDWGVYLYFALIDGGGNIITSPMAFMHGSDPTNPVLFNSDVGKGIAAFSPVKGIFIPVIRK